MEGFKIRGETQEEKFASIEHALQSMTRRTVQRATVYIPPVPVFIQATNVVEGGLVGKFIVPFDGKIKGIVVRSAAVIEITIVVESRTYQSKNYFPLEKRWEYIAADIDLAAGDTIQVLVSEGTTDDVLAAMAIYPTLEDHVAKKYLLEEILAQEKGEEDALHQAEE